MNVKKSYTYKFLCSLVASFSLFFGAQFASAENSLLFKSSVEQVEMVELYTSEGCSSCPPADRWLSGFKEDPDLWVKFVPASFHVSYWDYLGWKDIIGSEKHTTRQRRYAKLWRSNSIYTPGFVLNGTEWRNWRWTHRIPNQSKRKVGVLQAEVNKENINIQFLPEDPSRSTYYVSIAYLGFDLSSEILSGENRGKDLKHDFAVLKHEVYEMEKIRDQWSVETPFNFTNQFNLPLYGLAVWVHKKNDQRPVQATGGFFKRA